MTSPARQGLFAFEGESLHVHYQDAAELDHVAWFERVGLPSHGPTFDALLRGKVSVDPDTGHAVIGFYSAPFLSNRRYQQVVTAFGLDEDRVTERRLSEPY